MSSATDPRRQSAQQKRRAERNRRYRANHLEDVKLTQALWYMRNEDRLKARRLGTPWKPPEPVFQKDWLSDLVARSVASTQGDREMQKRMTVEQAAEFLAALSGVSVSVSSVRAWKRAGMLSHYKFKGMLLFDEGDLRSFFEAHRVQVGPMSFGDSSASLPRIIA